MSGPGEPAVDQLVFAPGANGVACLGTSLPQSRSLPWEQRLLPLVRLQSFSGQQVPDSSLSYFSFDRMGVAVVRRVNDGWSAGRHSAHAVVGRPEVLTPARALAMASWSGWVGHADQDGLMDQLTREDLPGGAVEGPRPPGGWLTALVAAHLREPRANLTVVGVAEDDRIPLLRGLVGVLEPVWAGSELSRRWTFSTHEQSVDQRLKHAAEVVFLPGFEKGVTLYAGSLVRLDSAPADDWQAEAATVLVDEYLRGEGVAAMLADAGVPAEAGVAGRLELLRRLAVARSEPTVVLPVHTSATYWGLHPDSSSGTTEVVGASRRSVAGQDEAEDVRAAIAGGTGGLVDSTGGISGATTGSADAGGTAGSAGADGTRSGAGGTSGGTTGSVGGAGGTAGGAEAEPAPDRLALAKELVAADGPAEAARVLAALAEAGPEESPGVRFAIRGALLDRRFAGGRVDAIGEHLPQVYPVVTRLCFGDRMADLRLEDRPTLEAVGDLVLDNRTSSGLVRALVEEAAAAGKSDLLLPAIGVRELRHQSVRVGPPQWSGMWCPAPDAHRPPPTPTPLPAGFRVTALPAVLVWRDFLLSVRILALLGVLLFMIGLIVGVAQRV